MQDATISPRLMTAFDRVWSAIRARHAEVPAVVITIGQGSGGKGDLRYGHFAAGRWQVGSDRLAELFIGGEGLERGAVAVLGTLLHEAAHGLAVVRGVQDTSRQGRWHNAKFQKLATEMGVTVTKDRRIGWSVTTVPDETVKIYRAEVRRLESALVAWRHSEPRGLTGGGASNNGVSALCGCERRIRVAASVLGAGPITCGVCGQDFATAES